ncbi:hypothetical protein DM02DRAFT_643131 [Periconia macrospinosa]|uniref:Uncharacterized protein n=1 Tax=Periconia macrospinosa TaxID=97972 RepID=A0A2V1DM40_9PLEO|nr:hypothetical protein DM02DRAFT_643131 [Periconia macrospinosa]
MSSNLVDTIPGGEDTPYEQDNSDVKPHAKQAGQLGDPVAGTTTHTKSSASDAPNTQGVSVADKIRYGQSIQEGGGFGGTEALDQKDGSAAEQRRAQGYGGEKDMDRSIGA